MVILTSSVASVADHLYSHFLKDREYKSILFIDTAAELHAADDLEWLQKDFDSLRRQGYRVDRYTITGKNKEEIAKTLDAYDILYMSGGNTAYLLNQLHTTGAFELIKNQVENGKPYIGTSAGSIAAGPRLPDYFLNDIPDLADSRGFNFVCFMLVPHWGAAHFRERHLGNRFEQVYTESQEPLLLLTDSQYVFVEQDGSLRLMSV